MSSVSNSSGVGSALAFSTTSPSGLNINSLISALTSVDAQNITKLQTKASAIRVEESDYTTLKGYVSSLATSLQKFTDANLGSDSDPFQAKTVTSSNSAAVSATVTNGATIGSYSIAVSHLAAATQANSTAGVGALTTSTSALSAVDGGAITAGNFTLFVNNKAYTIATTPSTQKVGDVLNSIVNQINTATGNSNASASVVNGQVQINTGGASIQFGATGDTSNIAQLLGLSTGSTTSGTFTAGATTSIINQNATLTDNSANLNSTVTAGTVTIGGAQFTIDATTTMTQLLANINSSSTAGVIATYNTNTNQIQLTSKVTGNQAITLGSSSDTSNALQVFNLVSGSNDALSSQTLGSNAVFSINGGSNIQSQSNSVSSAITGLTGVTLNLQGLTSASAANINVQQNTSTILSQVNTFISAFNAVHDNIAAATANGADLANNTTLTSLSQTLITQGTQGYTTSTIYQSLADIGINTGAVGQSVSADPSTGPSQDLQLNQSVFLAALQTHPTEVENLLLGTTAKPGIFKTLLATTQTATDPSFGIFASEANAASAQIQNINNSITQAQTQLSAKITQLQKEFTNMNTLVAQYQSQSSAVSSLSRSLTG